MALQAVGLLKEPVREQPVTAADLVRQLVLAVAGEPPGDAGSPPTAREPEEIILDVNLDDARYLLVRLPKGDMPRVKLSPREQEIVGMVAQGHSNKVIADVLSISTWTVCTHLRRIFAKLGVGSRAAMVAQFLANTPPPTRAR